MDARRARTLASGLLLSLLLLPMPAQASPPTPTAPMDVAQLEAALDALRGFGVRFAGDAADAGAAVGNRTVAGGALDLRPLGDVDGDGAGDVLAVVRSYGEDAADTAQALSGRDLATVLWTLPLVEGQSAGAAGDLDGDGLTDVYRFTDGGFTESSAPVGAGVVYVGEMAYAGTYTWEFLSGKALQPLGKHDAGFASQDTSATAYPPMTYASAEAGTATSTDLLALGHGVFGILDLAHRSRDAFAFGLAGFAMAGEGRTALGYTAPGGTRAAFEGDLQDVAATTAAPLDGTPGLDLVVLVAEDAADAYAYGPGVYQTLDHARTHRIAAVGSADGKVLWERTFEQSLALARSVALVPVGDLDGDGRSEVEYLQITSTDGDYFTSTATILSGKDGTHLHTSIAGNQVTAALPFGDIDGDGKAEVLAVTVGEAGVTVGAAKADLVPIWTVALAIDQMPLVQGGSTYDSMLTVPDWTGDGVPDLVVGNRLPYAFEEDAPRDAKAAAYDGSSGKALWTVERQGLFSYGTAGDISGTGDLDLVFTTAPGVGSAGNASFGFEVIAGETGQPILADTMPFPGDPFDDAWISVRTLGNLDGVGGPEFGVLVGMEDEDDAPGEPVVEWRIYPGTAGAETLVVSAPPAGPASDAPATVHLERDAPPQLRNVPDETAAPEETKGTPGLGAFALLAALAAAALLVTRRRL